MLGDFFGRFFVFRQNLTSGIYGTLLVMTVVSTTAADTALGIWASMAVVVVTVFVFWVSHVYARTLGSSLERGKPIDRERLRAVASDELPILQSALFPVVALLGGAVGLYADVAAYWVAITMGLAALTVWGVLYGRDKGLGVLGTAAVAGVNVGLGLVVVVLKAVIVH